MPTFQRAVSTNTTQHMSINLVRTTDSRCKDIFGYSDTAYWNTRLIVTVLVNPILPKSVTVSKYLLTFTLFNCPEGVTVTEDVCNSWLPDGYTRILRSYVFGPSGFWTMAPLRCTAKFDRFLSLDCARVEGGGAQSKERKGSNFAA